MDLDQFQAKLKEFDALRDSDEIKTGVVDRIKPQFVGGWPTELDSRVREALISAGITTPYKHQSEAIRKSLQGYDVVLESPTASGKTLAFTAPMLHSLVRNEGSHALMIYPMKALAFDQRDQIRRLCEPLGVESWPYDGDTPDEHKSVMRLDPPNILLTNPEYLNMSFLSWWNKWEDFLRKLKFVVIDEMHEYRGFFGSNMALLLRRFFLLLDRLGVSPRIFLSTATCANPVEHAYNLTGRKIEPVNASNALRPRRHFLFVQPDIPEHLYWQILQLRVEQAALTLLESNLQTLIFCPTKRFLEDAYSKCRVRARENRIRSRAYIAFPRGFEERDSPRYPAENQVRRTHRDFYNKCIGAGLGYRRVRRSDSGRVSIKYHVSLATDRTSRAQLGSGCLHTLLRHERPNRSILR